MDLMCTRRKEQGCSWTHAMEVQQSESLETLSFKDPRATVVPTFMAFDLSWIFQLTANQPSLGQCELVSVSCNQEKPSSGKKD